MPRLTREEVDAELEKTPGWTLDGDEITRKVECPSFPMALLLINAVGHYAERVNHHPKITNVYKWVTFDLSTHDAKGLTTKDFSLAREINKLV